MPKEGTKVMNKGRSGCHGSHGALGPGGGDREEGVCYCGRPLVMIGIDVSPTTGGQFQLKVAATDTMDFLRRLVSKRLKVPKERICLLYRDKHLREGTLEENNIIDGARITLLPSVETGLLTQRPEQSVMQALESLNDGQVNDFLSGHAPLNLTMRLGENVMLIQLQLSTVKQSGGSGSSSRHSSSSSSYHHHNHLYHSSCNHIHNMSHASQNSNSTSSSHNGSPYNHHHHPHHHHTDPSPSPSTPTSPSLSQLGSTLSSLTNSLAAAAAAAAAAASGTSSSHSASHRHMASLSLSSSSSSHHHSQSFYSPPHHPHNHHHHSTSSPSSSAPSSPSAPASPLSSHSGFGLDPDPPIRGCPHLVEESTPKMSLDTKALAEASRNLTQTLKQLSSEVLTTKFTDKDKPKSQESVPSGPSSSGGRSSSNRDKYGPMNAGGNRPSGGSASSPNCPLLFSSTPSTLPSPLSTSQAPASMFTHTPSKCKRQGAIIESMQQHGKGVYSGTFSGTLNPALQDREGRPRRDISTIIHILNDLLCATPQYRRHSSTSNSQSRHSSKGESAAKSESRKQAPPTVEETEQMEEDAVNDSQLTRSKMEQLKYKLEQRRARRKARREARANPYTTSISTTAALLARASGKAAATGPMSNTSTTAEESLDDETSEAPSDQTTLCELNSGTVVS